jgi:hypothetical protein
MNKCTCLELAVGTQNNDVPVANAALSLAEEEALFILNRGCLNWSEYRDRVQTDARDKAAWAAYRASGQFEKDFAFEDTPF